MTEFLLQVARHYRDEGTIEGTAFVFPSRRAAVFFRKYLAESVPHAMIAPPMMTMGDFFARTAGATVADRIPLLLRLYRLFKELNPAAGPLDEFIFWGDAILGDFDDIDKYLADARMLLANLSDLRAIEDRFEYLTPTQEKAVSQFLSHFKDSGDTIVKQRFKGIWNLLYPLYERFRQSLSADGLAYEGMLYRSVATMAKEGSLKDALAERFPGTERFVFVGLNALNECEKAVLSKMRDGGIAEFEWDYVSSMISHPLNRSSVFMKENIRSFPQAFPLADDPRSVPVVRVVSVPSSVGQAKLLPRILEEEISRQARNDKDAIKTAVVLGDEGMLLPVLNSIPEGIGDVNVTMGYPMGASSVYALVNALATLRQSMRVKDGTLYFYHRPMKAVFSNSVFAAVVSEEEISVIEKVKAAAKYYVPASDLTGGLFLDLVFRPGVETVGEIEKWLLEVLVVVGERLAVTGQPPLETDFTKRYWSAVRLLSTWGEKESLLRELKPAVWFRVLDSIVRGETVPFEGEPLKGLQIMGPLETRALDFDTVVILSANEGIFPRHSVAESFIPPQLRKGFGLPTYEHQDAMWAYYFYRLLQRAQTVWMISDSRTEGIRTGEESRFVKQLEYHFRVKVERYAVSYPVERRESENAVPKTEEDIKVLFERSLSASTLKNYLDCPAKFYYQFIKGLREDEEVSESLDTGQIGNVFHKAMETLYTGDGPEPLARITREYIEGILAKPERIRSLVDSLIREEMHTIEVTGRNLIVSDLICRYVVKTLETDRDLMASRGTDSFAVLGLEKKMYCSLGRFRFKGYIDRMDSFAPGTLRVVDYKTGRVEDNDINIDDDNAEEVADLLFGPDNSKRPKIALQLFLYDVFVREDKTSSPPGRIFNAIYAPASLFVGPPPEKELSPKFASIVRERLSSLLDEIVNPEIPFTRTDDRKTCSWCDFKNICGR